MAKQDTDPCRVIGDLIANAIATAGVLGESRRITTLVAGSIRRFMAEMDDAEADLFLMHVQRCIPAAEVEKVPALNAELQAILQSRS